MKTIFHSKSVCLKKAKQGKMNSLELFLLTRAIFNPFSKTNWLLMLENKWKFQFYF